MFSKISQSYLSLADWLGVANEIGAVMLANTRITLNLVVAAYCVLTTTRLFALAPYTLKAPMKGDLLGLYFLTYEDESQTLDLQGALEAEKKGLFVPSTEEVPNYGLNPSAQWVKFSLHNPTDQTVEIYLENGIPFVDEFELFWQEGDRWHLKRGGDQIDFNSRDIQTRQVVFHLFLEPGTHTYYARTIALGTMQLPLRVWSPDEFHASNAVEYGVIGVLIGIHVVICLYNLFLYFSLRDKTYLYYVSYVAANLVFQWVGLGLLQKTTAGLGLSGVISNKIFIVTVDLVAITSYLFSAHFLNIQEKLPWMYKLFNGAIALSIANILITLFIAPSFGTVFCFVTASLATNLLIFSGLIIARRGDLPAKYYLTAWSCYLFGVTITVSNFLGFTPTTVFSQWGQFTGGAFEIAILSLALGARINEKKRQHIEQINELNQNLEKKVEERTAEVKSLLRHIPQGILSIRSEGRVEPEFSAQLPSILETDAIADQSIETLLVDHLILSADEKDQIKQTINACLDEDRLNFDVNEQKLPRQVRYSAAVKTKALRLTWNIQCDPNDRVTHILVTLLDITAEVEAQEELQRKTEKFVMLEELVEVSSKKSLQFFNACDQLLSENYQLIHNGEINQDSMKILFVNTHTMKGAARSLHFKELSDVFHHVESYYAKILKEQHVIDMNIINRDLTQAVSTYESYKQINSETLGRDHDTGKITLDRDFIQDSMQLLDQLIGVNELSVDLQTIIRRNLDVLTEKIFVSMKSILDDCLIHSEKIARDLGKEIPVIESHVDHILLTPEQESALRNSMVHLLRNALDHGIEDPDQRRYLGKPPRGRLLVEARKNNQEFTVVFSDDGAGLDLRKVRERSKKLGLQQKSNSPEDLALMIFEPGFSTAEKISLVSGRGIGMGAVKKYIEEIGGQVEIRLLNRHSDKTEIYSFQTIIHLTDSNARQVHKLSTLAS